MGEPRGELLVENYLPEGGRSNFYPSGEGKMWRPQAVQWQGMTRGFL